MTKYKTTSVECHSIRQHKSQLLKNSNKYLRVQQILTDLIGFALVVILFDTSFVDLGFFIAGAKENEPSQFPAEAEVDESSSEEDESSPFRDGGSSNPSILQRSCNSRNDS